MNGAAFIPCRLHRRGAEECCLISWETLIKSLSDFTLEVLYMARNQYFFKTSAPSYDDAPYHHS